MKKTTVFILAVFSIFFASKSYAQFGVQAGYIYSKSKGNLELGQFSHFSGYSKNHGFQVGPTYDFNLGKNFSIQTALLYSFLGGTTTESDQVIDRIRGDFKTKSEYQYLDLPIRLAYSLVVNEDFKIFFFGGPNLTYGLSAKLKEGEINGKFVGSSNTAVKKIPGYDIYNDYKDDISRFDAQLGVGGGIYYNHFRLKIGYDFGIFNLYTGQKRKNSAGKINSLKRGELAVSIGYVF